MEIMIKENVKNPLSCRNTVGAELADIFEIRGLENYGELLGVKDLRRKEKLSETIRKKAAFILDDEGLVSYLQRFEDSYLRDKPKYLEKFAKAKKAYKEMKDIVPLLKNEFNDPSSFLLFKLKLKVKFSNYCFIKIIPKHKGTNIF